MAKAKPKRKRDVSAELVIVTCVFYVPNWCSFHQDILPGALLRGHAILWALFSFILLDPTSHNCVEAVFFRGFARRATFFFIFIFILLSLKRDSSAATAVVSFHFFFFFFLRLRRICARFPI